MTLEGIIVNGQVQLDAPAPLPTGTRVRIEAVEPARTPEYEAHLDRLYELLSLRFDGGESDVAARHNEHQP
jgi:hypothetical protein